MLTFPDARGWGTHIGHVRRGIPRPSQPAAVPPHMSVLLVDVESPISSETQETVVSILSLGSSVLFVIVILGTGKHGLEQHIHLIHTT